MWGPIWYLAVQFSIVNLHSKDQRRKCVMSEWAGFQQKVQVGMCTHANAQSDQSSMGALLVAKSSTFHQAEN